MNRSLLALWAGIATGILAGCDRTTAAGTTDDTHSSILVTGRVFNDQSRPLGAVIVKLRHAGLSDTTDGDGRFAIRGDRSALAARTLSAVDTLDYLRDGMVVLSAQVAAWIDTLPDVFLVQRDIHGPVGTGKFLPSSVAGTLWNASGDSTALTLEWNPQTLSYSGFTWFRYTGGVDSFRVRTRTLDSLGRITGLSPVIRFTSVAGNISIPSFDAANASVQIALRGPSLLRRGDTARFRSGAANALGLPMSFEWRLGGSPWSAGGADTLMRLPLDLAGPAATIHLRAARADGLLSEDSLRIPVEPTPPSAGIAAMTDSVAYGHAFEVRFSDGAATGSHVVRRRLGSPWNVDVSGRDTTLLAPDSIGVLSLVYRVWSDLGDSTTATSDIRLVAGKPRGVQAVADSSGITVTLPRVQGGGGWFVGWSDPSLPSCKFSWYAPPESGRIHFPRLSASSRLDLAVHINGPAGFGPETTLVVETPPLAIDFEAGCTEAAEWDHCFWLANQPSWVTATAILRNDPVTGRSWLHFPIQGKPWSGFVGPGVLPVWGWSGNRSIEMKVRSSTPIKLQLAVDLELIPGAEATPLHESYRSLGTKGTSLVWETTVSGADSTLRLPFDSLKWTDGAPHPELPLDSVVRAAQGIDFRIVCGDANSPCPAATDAAYLEVTDIRFRP